MSVGAGDDRSAGLVGQFAIVRMVAEKPTFRVARIDEFYPPDTEGQVYADYPIPAAPYARVALRGVALVDLDSVERIIGSEVEAKLFAAEEALAWTRADLGAEKEAHARTRERLSSLRQDLERLLDRYR